MLNPPRSDDPGAQSPGHALGVAALGVAVLAVVTAVAMLVTRTDVTSAASATMSAPTPAGASPACSYIPDGTPAVPVRPPAQLRPPHNGTLQVELTTSAGPIPLTLDRSLAPCSVASMLSLATQGYFSNTLCHRLTTSVIFVLQCGDPTGNGTGGPGYTVPDEPPAAGSADYPRGTVAMSNAGQPHTGGSQFFLVYRDSPLPPAYTVLGTVGEAGLLTVDRVAAAGTVSGSGDGSPARPVTIRTVSAAG